MITNDRDPIPAAIHRLVREAIDDEYYTASGERVMISLERLIELGCADESDARILRGKINEFNERNPVKDYYDDDDR